MKWRNINKKQYTELKVQLVKYIYQNNKKLENMILKFREFLGIPLKIYHYAI